MNSYNLLIYNILQYLRGYGNSSSHIQKIHQHSPSSQFSAWQTDQQINTIQGFQTVRLHHLQLSHAEEQPGLDRGRFLRKKLIKVFEQINISLVAMIANFLNSINKR